MSAGFSTTAAAAELEIGSSGSRATNYDGIPAAETTPTVVVAAAAAIGEPETANDEEIRLAQVLILPISHSLTSTLKKIYPFFNVKENSNLALMKYMNYWTLFKI